MVYNEKNKFDLIWSSITLSNCSDNVKTTIQKTNWNSCPIQAELMSMKQTLRNSQYSIEGHRICSSPPLKYPWCNLRHSPLGLDAPGATVSTKILASASTRCIVYQLTTRTKYNAFSSYTYSSAVFHRVAYVNKDVIKKIKTNKTAKYINVCILSILVLDVWEVENTAVSL